MSNKGTARTCHDSVVELQNKKNEEKEGKEQFMKLTCTIIKWLCHFNLLPYIWKEDRGQLMRHGSGVYFYLWVVTVPLVSWFNLSFVLVRFLHCLLLSWRKGGQTSDLFSSVIVLWSALALRSIMAVITWILWRESSLVFSFTNQILRFRKLEGGPELRRDFPASKILTGLLVLRTVQLILAGCSQATRPQFVYSLLPAGYRRNYYFFALYILFTIMTNLSTLLIIYFAALPLLTVNTLEVILRRMSTPHNPQKEVGRMCKLLWYRQLQILLCQSHACTGPLFWNYLKVYTLLISTSCAFGCVRFYDNLDFRIYATLPMSLFTLMAYSYEWYGGAGQIPKMSQNAVHHLFHCGEIVQGSAMMMMTKAEQFRCLKSCPKLVVASVKRHTFPSILKFVGLQTIRLLIVSMRG